VHKFIFTCSINVSGGTHNAPQTPGSASGERRTRGGNCDMERGEGKSRNKEKKLCLIGFSSMDIPTYFTSQFRRYVAKLHQMKYAYRHGFATLCWRLLFSVVSRYIDQYGVRVRADGSCGRRTWNYSYVYEYRYCFLRPHWRSVLYAQRRL